MKLSGEQAKQLQEKLAAENNSAEAAKVAREYGIDVSAEDMEKILDQVSGGGRIMSEDMLAQVSGGSCGQLNITDFQYTVIKESYDEGGPNRAIAACILMIPSPICYDVIQYIEAEEKKKKKK